MNAPTLLLVLLMVGTLTVTAQPASSQKIGHADTDYIFSQLPEFKRIQSELQTFETQLQNQLKVKSSELETKYKAYQTMPPTTPDAIRADKESELTYLQENLQKFREEAVASIQKKQNDLVTPVFERISKSIKEVALENGYTYILNPRNGGGADMLLFSDDKYNVADLVLKKLGVIPKLP